MKKIIAAIDFSDVTDAVVEKAAEIAKAFNAELILLHSDPMNPNMGYDAFSQNIATNPPVMGYDSAMPTPTLIAEEEEIGQQSKLKLEQLCDKIKHEGIQSSCTLLKGKPEDEIKIQAKAIEADMVVIGTHKHSALHHMIFGEVSRSFVSEAPCPVLVVPMGE